MRPEEFYGLTLAELLKMVGGHQARQEAELWKVALACAPHYQKNAKRSYTPQEFMRVLGFRGSPHSGKSASRLKEEAEEILRAHAARGYHQGVA